MPFLRRLSLEKESDCAIPQAERMRWERLLLTEAIFPTGRGCAASIGGFGTARVRRQSFA
jgi:hypothetical protein